LLIYTIESFENNNYKTPSEIVNNLI